MAEYFTNKEIIDKFVEIFNTQKELNKKIIEKYNLEKEYFDRFLMLKNYFFAYISEVGEMLKEINFKFWKKDEVDKRFYPKENSKIKEEAIDLLHFAISIYIYIMEINERKIERKDVRYILNKIDLMYIHKEFWNISLIYNELIRAINILTNFFDDIFFGKEIKQKNINNFLLMSLAFICNFFDSYEDIINNYFDKNKINHNRIENDY